ncbi:SixA phosphatase family protein [Sinomicrobium weinanense]|uniref:Histidine phosphatase family protein n=1 Tax=Sinomicrobium weinanense TaxID=2842200 RepID=A0A926JRZ8_9FLAO|nr:histidine phosphatase family protein [Sinomicrobium weinanense]MBC9796229.1 histidine phosphatase family protein [Sinomicrobium weinanense]MBU3122316.1 histidine phosphatase family protein [Sinomicrobium weinanense]
MKQLTLIRHAKSSWDYSVEDRNRPLKERGMMDAEMVSSHVRGKVPVPDMAFSSPANRALHTCTIFLKNLDIPLSRLQLTEALYDFSGSSVDHFLRTLDNRYKNVMIFGHNHAFTAVSNKFGDKYTDNLPTSGLVHITFKAEHWAEIGKGTTDLMVFPKHLR